MRFSVDSDFKVVNLATRVINSIGRFCSGTPDRGVVRALFQAIASKTRDSLECLRLKIRRAHQQNEKQRQVLGIF